MLNFNFKQKLFSYFIDLEQHVRSWMVIESLSIGSSTFYCSFHNHFSMDFLSVLLQASQWNDTSSNEELNRIKKLLKEKDDLLQVRQKLIYSLFSLTRPYQARCRQVEKIFFSICFILNFQVYPEKSKIKFVIWVWQKKFV